MTLPALAHHRGRHEHESGTFGPAAPPPFFPLPRSGSRDLMRGQLARC